MSTTLPASLLIPLPLITGTLQYHQELLPDFYGRLHGCSPDDDRFLRLLKPTDADDANAIAANDAIVLTTAPVFPADPGNSASAIEMTRFQTQCAIYKDRKETHQLNTTVLSSMKQLLFQSLSQAHRALIFHDDLELMSTRSLREVHQTIYEYFTEVTQADLAAAESQLQRPFQFTDITSYEKFTATFIRSLYALDSIGHLPSVTHQIKFFQQALNSSPDHDMFQSAFDAYSFSHTTLSSQNLTELMDTVRVAFLTKVIPRYLDERGNPIASTSPQVYNYGGANSAQSNPPRSFDARTAGPSRHGGTLTSQTTAGRGRPHAMNSNTAAPRRYYCWTHGTGLHSSLYCNHPAPGHVKEANFHTYSKYPGAKAPTN